MADVRTLDAVDRLTDGATGCLGALFLTYTFDATFFEEEILAAVLSLQEDPADATHRFLEEGRRRLVETPVVVIADPGMLRGGQRLPYDLLRASPARTFHPKLALLVNADTARLVVGSGNLTLGGYGGNAELAAALVLDYTRDAELLLGVVEFAKMCGARGEAWKRLLAELEPRIGAARAAAKPEDPDAYFVHTFSGDALLDTFLKHLPDQVTIDRIGVLAPFHQEDGAPPDAALFDRLIDATRDRHGRDFVLDVGISWEGNAVAARPADRGQMEAHPGELWGIGDGNTGRETTRWLVLGQHSGRSFEVGDGRSTWRLSTRELRARSASATAWPVGEVDAFAPEELVDRAAARVEVRLWLHPEIHRRDGRVYRQPLHGKLIAICGRQGRRRRTWLLVGSPNASAAAMLRPDGNVECALVLTVDGHHHIGSLCDTLVHVPRDQVALRGRTFTTVPPSPARWVADAVYNAAQSTLLVTWNLGAPRLVVRYPTTIPRSLLDGVPTAPSSYDEFVLDPACCELEVVETASERTGRVPIRVEQVVMLPVQGMSGELTLDELLLLHSGRLTPAGVAARRKAAGPGDDASGGAAAVFGALTPREVFRALLSIGVSLREASSLGAFHALVESPLGVRRLAERIAEAPSNGQLMHMEAWVYGQELARVLECLTFRGDPTAIEKEALRDAAVAWLRAHLQPASQTTPGTDALNAFYLGSHET